MRNKFIVIITGTIAAAAILTLRYGRPDAPAKQPTSTTPQAAATPATPHTTSQVSLAAKGDNALDTASNAAKRALDELQHFRTAEMPRRDGITHVARDRGNIELIVTLDKRIVENKDGVKSEWIDVTACYDKQADSPQGQQVIAKISAELQ